MKFELRKTEKRGKKKEKEKKRRMYDLLFLGEDPSNRERSINLEILGITGCSLYICLLIISVGSLFVEIIMRRRFVRTLPGARSTSTYDERKHRASVLFHVVVIVFTFARAFMFFDVEEGVGHDFIGSDGEYNIRDIIDACVRKVGFDLHYVTYTIIVYWWVITYNRSFRSSGGSSVETAKWTFIVLDAIVFVVTFAFVVVYGITEDTAIMQPVYLGVTSCLDLALCVAVPILAIFVYVRQKDEVWFLRAERRETLRVLWCSGVFFLCSLMRSALPMYSVFTRRRTFSAVFYTFTYIVPETVSTLLQLYILHAKSESKTHDEMLIEALYNEARQADGPGAMRAPLLSVNKEAMPVPHLYNTESISGSSSNVSVPYKN